MSTTVTDPPSAAGNATDPAVEVEGITKRFPGVIANQDVTFAVARGTVHAIVGENGAGKSTLMKMLYGVQRPDEGTIRINGESVSLHSPADAIKHGVGMVFQHFMLADNLTVTENVVLGAEKLHGIGAGARAEITRISDEYGLGIDPRDLVADPGSRRPTAGGDPQGALPRRPHDHPRRAHRGARPAGGRRALRQPARAQA
ncbi:ATP-binding cassette domain-containing protein [Janibacter limosus]|uniref:ATP-binding cassette domain-containing protein n=1 Tax=Janibacter limosus TaxID=53458 RepID=A0AC61U235_9MICO|nr:ATP-binding cassette domain-containing protein [Janibacter limosus]UUZ44033.1 ATP-binding cassette domain-containing protein [Janibacter limosus]